MCKNLFFIGIIAFILFFQAQGSAQEDYGRQLVTDIRVENNKLISTPTILSKVRLQIGDVFSQDKLNDDIKNLYATGYFTDITVDLNEYQEGIAVTFIVTEKPLLEEIIFRGNEKISSDRLRGLIETKVGQPLDYVELKQDLETIKDFYIKEGFHLAVVEEEILVNNETNEARVFILVDEGLRYRIKRINVEGNQIISDKAILKAIKTRPDGLFTSGYFDEQVFENDIKRIKSLYSQKGYTEAQVSYDIDYDKKDKHMIITIDVKEGQAYIVKSLSITGNTVFTEAQLEEVLKMKPGATYIPNVLEEDMAAINEKYFEKGYISARVVPDVAFDEKSQQMAITYDIAEDEKAYIEKIEITGNDKTKDIVIRRELAVVPGEVFDGNKLRKSKRNLNNLGYFEEISYNIEPGSASNKKNLVIDVKEAKTGEISFGAGYSSIDKFIGFVEIKQRNFDISNFPSFTGDGQQLSLRAEFGTEKKYYDLSFTEPWLFNRPVSFGFDFYNRYRSWTLYDRENFGGDVRLGWRLGEDVRLDTMYKLEDVKVGNIPDWASRADFPDVWEEEGKHTVSSMSLTLSRDTRDNRFSPKEGGIIENTVQVAGGPFGGDRDFAKYYAGTSWYFTHFEDFTLELKLRGGIADKYDDTAMVPIYERFYAGGANTIRGYQERHVGPKIGNEPIGGNSMLVGNAEYTFPVLKNIKGAVFYDVGNVWPEISDFGNDFRSAVGVGVRVKTPLGPVKLDYGYGLDYEPGEDDNGRFHFSMSRGF